MNRLINEFVLAAFVMNLVMPPTVSAQIIPPTVLDLPVPGTRVNLSPAFAPILMRGMKISPTDPFQFHFVVDPGESQFSEKAVKE